MGNSGSLTRNKFAILSGRISPAPGDMSAKPVLAEVSRTTEPPSRLTPQMKEFIDLVIVPILVKEYLSTTESENDLAGDAPDAAHSVSSTSAPRPTQVKL